MAALDASSTSPTSASSSTNTFRSSATSPDTALFEPSSKDGKSASVSQSRFRDTETPSRTGSSFKPTETLKRPRNIEHKDPMDNLGDMGLENGWPATAGLTSGNIFPPRKNQKGDAKEESYLRCVTCQEVLSAHSVTKVPCRDQYCVDCIQELFSASLVDDSLFLPRCCRQNINPDAIREFLTPDLVTAYLEKKVEAETLDRTYCSDPRCSVFLKPENITGNCATCPKCNKETCTMCKAPRFVFYSFTAPYCSSCLNNYTLPPSHVS